MGLAPARGFSAFDRLVGLRVAEVNNQERRLEPTEMEVIQGKSHNRPIMALVQGYSRENSGEETEIQCTKL